MTNLADAMKAEVRTMDGLTGWGYAVGISLVDWAPLDPSVRRLASALGLKHSTWHSWQRRRGLASPRRLLDLTRLVIANDLLKVASARATARTMSCSSHAAFIRWLRTRCGSSVEQERATEFSERWSQWRQAMNEALKALPVLHRPRART